MLSFFSKFRLYNQAEEGKFLLEIKFWQHFWMELVVVILESY